MKNRAEAPIFHTAVCAGPKQPLSQPGNCIRSFPARASHKEPGMENKMRITEDLRYGEGEAELYDLFCPDGEGTDVLIWFHGGGWRSEELNRHYRPHGLLMQLCHAGFACVSADYRLLQQAAYPAPIQDARCAVRYVRACAEELNLDAEHIGVMGESAGAATAQLLGVGEYLPQHEGDGGYAEYSSRVQAVCSWYGFSNYIKSAQLTGMKAQRMLGVEYDYDGEGAKAMWKESTIAYADRPLPPFLLLHGTADPLVPSWQSIDMYKELISWGNEAELYMVPGEVHGFFTSPQAREKIVRFFRKHLMGRE